MAKRKGIIPPANVASTISTAEAEEARNAFISGGRGSSNAPEREGAPRGRPPIKRKVKPFPAKLWQEDALRVSQLQLSWQMQTESSSQIPMTGILRALLSTALPLLERMEPPSSEEEFEARLGELMSKI